ncbi:MAG: hypothetical protein ACLRM8_03675 [Alistipes sp.]
MKSRELMAACLNPGADTYMYRRVLRELVAKTDYATCIIQSGRTYYEWNRNLRPTLYDLTLRLEGGMHEVTNGFWSYENSHLLQPLYKANRQYESLTREYLSNIHIDELDSRRAPRATGPTAVRIPACGRTDGTTHQSPINIKK